MPQKQNILIEKVQKNTFVVLHAGAPVLMPWKDKVKAILNLYLGGEGVGEAAVSLLYGDTNPSGILAETYPLKLSDNPSYLNFPEEDGIVTYRESIFVGYRYYDKKEMEVAYPFGFGLSYTTFSQPAQETRFLAVGKTDISPPISDSMAIAVIGLEFSPGVVRIKSKASEKGQAGARISCSIFSLWALSSEDITENIIKL